MEKIRLLFIVVLTSLLCNAKADTSVWDGYSYNLDWYANGSGSIYHIKTAADLAGLSYCFANGFYLYGNMSGCTIILDNDIDLAGHEWTPIGLIDASNTYYEFAGTFDGNNHTIKGMSITKHHNGYLITVGLFGYNFSNSFVVKNLKVEGDIKLNNFSDVHKVYAGGIIGETQAGAIVNCQSSVNISIELNNSQSTTATALCGGIVGRIGQTNNVDVCKNCFSKGNINVVLNNSNKASAGGLIGLAECQNSVISNCASQSNITVSNGKWTNAGGIVGEANISKMEDAFFSGNITMEYPNLGYAGGMIGGDRSNSNNFNNCLMIGSITKNSGTGWYSPFVGSAYEGTTGNNCYYLSGIPNSRDFGTELSESELKSGNPISGFDTSIWYFSEGNYPTLQFLRTYSLSLIARGNGSISYEGLTIRNQSSSITINNGTNVTLSLNPDNGYKVKNVMINSIDVTSSLSEDNKYTISNFSKNTIAEVEFDEDDLKTFTVNDVNYSVSSYNEKTVSVAKGEYGIVLEVPAKVVYKNTSWNVTAIENGVMMNSSNITAIIWNPEVVFTENVSNPNLLLYVKSANYAPATIKNVIVNNMADNITLIDAANGNNFYCPIEFMAKKISYTHHYKMETGIGESKGWETIALPFDVQKVSHQSKGEIVPFVNWKSGDSKKPFWLMQMSSNGWTEAYSIKAYMPYIISMPNHTNYKDEFKLNGNVTFSSENVKIGKTEDLLTSSYNGRTFVPNFSLLTDRNCYALNVNNDYIAYQGEKNEGSVFFIGLRDVHPFEAYMTTASGTRALAIDDDLTTGIGDIAEIWDDKIIRVYNLSGQLLMTEENKSLGEIKKMLSAGVYIVNGKKIIIK